MTTKHTPGKLKQASDPTGAIRWYEAQTGNYQGLIIEETTGKSVAVTYNKDHAAFIVRACNAHEELLSACKAIVEALDDPDNGKDRDFMAAVDWRQLRAAIARAEVGV